MADLDGDGRTDLVSGSWPGELHWFRRKPNGTYATAQTLRTSNGTLNAGKASAIAVADWDGDRDLDLIIGNIEGQVLLAINEGDPQQPVFGRAVPLSAGGRGIKVDSDAGPHVADWDGDGRQDLLVGAGSGAVRWYRNTGTAMKPALAAEVTLLDDSAIQVTGTPKRSAGRSKPAVADWDGDGRPDLLVGDFWINSNASDDGGATHGGVWVYLQTANAGSPAVSERAP